MQQLQAQDIVVSDLSGGSVVLECSSQPLLKA